MNETILILVASCGQPAFGCRAKHTAGKTSSTATVRLVPDRLRLDNRVSDTFLALRSESNMDQTQTEHSTLKRPTTCSPAHPTRFPCSVQTQTPYSPFEEASQHPSSPVTRR